MVVNASYAEVERRLLASLNLPPDAVVQFIEPSEPLPPPLELKPVPVRVSSGPKRYSTAQVGSCAARRRGRYARGLKPVK